MPAARKQAQERWVDGIGPEVERRDVPVQVIDRDERDPAPPGEPLGGGQPDQQRADQPGPTGDADPVDLLERDTCSIERLAHDRRDELEMPA